MEWYEGQVLGLGLDLEAEVNRAIQILSRNPAACPPHKKSGLRKQHVRRFPYIVFFMELSDCIWIAAIAHAKRRPNYWKSRRPEET